MRLLSEAGIEKTGNKLTENKKTKLDRLYLDLVACIERISLDKEVYKKYDIIPLYYAMITGLKHQNRQMTLDDTVFKTHSIATNACNAGKVKLNGHNVKPSKEVKKGDIYEIRINQLEKKIEVLDMPKSRVGAPLTEQYYTDLTSPEEYDRVKMLRPKFEYCDHRERRPTKRDRRQIEYLKIILEKSNLLAISALLSNSSYTPTLSRFFPLLPYLP